MVAVTAIYHCPVYRTQVTLNANVTTTLLLHSGLISAHQRATTVKPVTPKCSVIISERQREIIHNKEDTLKRSKFKTHALARQSHKNWLHPANINTIKNIKENNDDNLQIFTDCSKNEHGVGAGVAICIGNHLIGKLTPKLDNRCSNNPVSYTHLDVYKRQV